MKVSLKLPDGTMSDHFVPVSRRSLMLTSEYNSSKVAEPAKAPAGKGGSSKPDEDDSKSIAKWILVSSALPMSM